MIKSISDITSQSEQHWTSQFHRTSNSVDEGVLPYILVTTTGTEHLQWVHWYLCTDLLHHWNST